MVLLVFFFSCSKKNSCETCTTEQGYVNATIVDSGPLESDGCGWVVKTGDDQFYHPDVLKPSFRQNGLAVKICFENTADQFHCGIAGAGMPVIRVLDIRK